MRRSISCYWWLPAFVGVALVMAAGLLLTSSLGRPVAPAASAQETNPYCDLRVSKLADRGSVQPGESILYTITVNNVSSVPGQTSQGCRDLIVMDTLHSFFTCESASVTNVDSLTIDTSEVERSCAGNQKVVWAFLGTLGQGHKVVLTLRLRVVEDVGVDLVYNEATACEATTLEEEGPQFCVGAQADTFVTGRHEVEATATGAPTPVASTSTPLPALISPSTGTGSGRGSMPWPAIAFGLGGICLLALSGGFMRKKRT